MDEKRLPQGWVRTTLDAVAMQVSKIATATGPDLQIRYIDISGIDNQANRIRETKDLSFGNAPSRARQIVQAGDTVFSTVRPYLRNIALVPDELDGEIASTGFCVLRPSEAVDARFLFHKVASQHFVNAVSADQYGASYPAVKDSQVRAQPIELPPLNEQHRIVDKLDTLFAELDQGEAELRQVQTLLARYRQSVLKAAVTGELTADWRARNVGRLESGHDLLARILDARRQNWQGRGKYKEPVAPDTTDLPELPEGWIWATVEQLASCDPYALAIGPFGSNLKVSDYRDEGVPLVFVRNIRAKDFEGLAPKFVSKQKAEELAAHTVQPGDLLVTKMGDPPGDVCIYPENQEVAIITADCIRFATHSAVVSAYMEIAISSQVVQRQIQKISKGVAQQKVTLAGFKKIVLPLPPREEQDQIDAMVHELFDEVSSVALNCQSELTRSTALRQSILKDAFAGKLVPQDPTDEPASALLARIRAEREVRREKGK